jgi:muramoyltetrapeptide carboxypeptidase
MEIQVPRPLGKGSKVAMVAPSSLVPPALEPRLELVLAHLRGAGLDPRELGCLRADETPPREVRLAAWMEALLSDEYDAVFPPWGGERAIELLTRIDFERLRSTRPKWILGYSDISTLLVPLLLEAGWASAHGPNAMDLVPDQTDPLTSRTLSWLSSTGAFTQRSSTHHQTAWVDWKQRPGAAFQLDQPTRVRTLDGRRVEVDGRLIGGCIDTLANLVGTRFGDIPRFVREHRAEGVILFLENCELAPGQLTRALTQLRLAGWLADVKAVLFGRSAARDTNTATHETIVRRALAGLEIPVVLDADIGHVPPQWTLIEGALATVHVEDGSATIEQRR